MLRNPTQEEDLKTLKQRLTHAPIRALSEETEDFMTYHDLDLVAC